MLVIIICMQSIDPILARRFINNRIGNDEHEWPSLVYRFPVTQLVWDILVCQCLFIVPIIAIISIMQVYHLISCFLQAVDPTQNVASHDFADYISSLNSAINKHPNRARTRFHELVNILSTMLLDSGFTLDSYAKFYEVLVEAFCRCSLTVKHNSETIGQMLRAAVVILSKVQVQVTIEWSNPSNNDCEEKDAELVISSELMSTVDRLCVQIGNQIVRATFVPIFREYLELGQDWRQKYGALLVASKMGDEVEHIEEVKPFADCAIKELQSVHPKVRLAAVELLGELSYDITPIFQEEYFQTVVPMLIKLLGDQIPRVVSHTFASLSNFLSNLTQYWKIENISGKLLSSILHYLKNGTPYMKQAALDIVTALAKVRSCLGHNIAFLVQGCGEVLHTCQGQNEKQLLQGTFQALSEIFMFQDKKIVGKYLPQFVESLFSYKSRIDSSTFFACWNRLCMEYEAFADLESTNIIPFLLSESEREIEDGLEEVADMHLEYLCNTFKAFTWRMRPHMQAIFEFGKKIMQNSEVQFRIRNKSMEMIVSLLLNLRTAQVKQEDIFMDMAISILQYLIEFGDKCITEDGEILLLQGVLEGMNRLIEPLATALNQSSIMRISDKLLAFQQRLEEGLGNKEEELGSKEEEVDIVEANQQVNEANEASSGEEEVYVADQDNQDEETETQLLEIADLIPPVYGSLLKICRQGEKDMLINVLIPQISFAISKEFDWKMFGLNLALCLVQSCSYLQLSAYWGNLMMLFDGFVEDGSSKLRSMSAYGMGIIFDKTPQELIVEENVITWMQAIWKGNETPFDEEDDKAYVNFCKDNFVAALGKLIKSCGQRFPHLFSNEIYRKWLQSLPLKHDEQETDSQQELLIDILTNSPNLVVADSNDLKTICQIFASFMIMRCQSKQSKALMRSKECFTSISSWDIFKRSCDFLLSNLKPNHRNALNKLMHYE